MAKLGVVTNPVFIERLNKIVVAKVSPKTAYKIKKLTDRVREEILIFESLKKTKVAEVFGLRDEKGDLEVDEQGNYKIDESRQAEIDVVFQELTTIEVDVGTISINELNDKVELSAQDIAILSDILVE